MKLAIATKGLAILGAILVWAALAGQFVLLAGAVRSQGSTITGAIWRYLGFFTILTNILVALVFTHAALRPGRRTGLGAPIFESMVAVSIVLVGIVYSVALRALWSPHGAQKLADSGLHDIAPVLFAVFWLLRPHGGLRWHDFPWLLVWPLGYCLYALARGAADGWYPYPFLDAANLSLPRLVANIAVLIAAFTMVAFGLIALDRRLASSKA